MKSMYVVNLALQRYDGKTERDTFFTETKPTQKQAEEIAEKYSCSVIMSCAGRFTPYDEEAQEKYTFVAMKAEEKEAEYEV